MFHGNVEKKKTLPQLKKESNCSSMICGKCNMKILLCQRLPVIAVLMPNSNLTTQTLCCFVIRWSLNVLQTCTFSICTFSVCAENNQVLTDGLHDCQMTMHAISYQHATFFYNNHKWLVVSFNYEVSISLLCTCKTT